MQRYYTQQLTTIEATVLPTSPPQQEDVFLLKLRELIESDFEKNWTIDELCQTLHLSRSQLYRKIKALTGYSTTIYIRQLRLKQGVRLLQTTTKTISEIT